MITREDMEKAKRIPEAMEDQIDPGVHNWIKEEIKKFRPYDLLELNEIDTFLCYYFFNLGIKYEKWHNKNWWYNV
jgi:hypothetical protein